METVTIFFYIVSGSIFRVFGEDLLFAKKHEGLLGLTRPVQPDSQLHHVGESFIESEWNIKKNVYVGKSGCLN